MKLTKTPGPGDSGEEVRAFQKALFAKGYDPGAIDGRFGEITRQACARFQKSLGLEGTGTPGPNTMAALGFEIGDRVPQAPISIEPGKLQAALSWELPCNDGQLSQDPHPERRTWSEAAFTAIWNEYETFIKAKDIKTVIPELDSLSKEQRCTKLAELLSAIAKYECSWKPAATTVDVNGSSIPSEQATGFFQLNVEDQSVYHTGTAFNHEQLKDPYNNIKAGVGILVYLIQARGTITFKKGQGGMPSAFFETLMFGAKYENVQTILAMVAKIKFAATPKIEGKVTRQEVAAAIVAIIQKDVDDKLRETDGKNRSPRIDEFNSRVGVVMGSPYCASGGWCAIDDACKQLGLKNPVLPTASSQDFRKSEFVPEEYLRASGVKGMKGDVGTLQNATDKTHGHHTTLTKDQTDKSLFDTAEYNTDSGGKSDGDGAYNRTRSTNDYAPRNDFKKFISFADIPQWIVDFNS